MTGVRRCLTSYVSEVMWPITSPYVGDTISPNMQPCAFELSHTPRSNQFSDPADTTAGLIATSKSLIAFNAQSFVWAARLHMFLGVSTPSTLPIVASLPQHKPRFSNTCNFQLCRVARLCERYSIEVLRIGRFQGSRIN